MAKISIFGFDEPKGYENSGADWNQDRRDADRRHMTTSEYEDSAHDRVADKAGEKRMRDKDADAKVMKNETTYKKGGSAFSNTPKSAHGFGHKTEHKKGHLRMSGHAGAHQVGKKK
jgi:hypothetical protein